MPNHRATIDVRAARDVYRRGGNVIAFLKESYGDAVPLSEIIEVAYDLQAGSYVAAAEAKRESVRPYWNEMAARVREHGNAPVTVLDAGTGELTTLCGLWESLGGMRSAERVYAFDISWSRLTHGRAYLQGRAPDLARRTRLFVADTAAIPLPAGSMDLVLTAHALEPNRAQQDRLVAELLRVARGRLLLFEPGYEIASEEARARMDRHGYVRDLDASIARAGGRVISRIPFENSLNPLNPTQCWVIDAPKSPESEDRFTVPGGDLPLVEANGFLRSEEAGLSFPVLDGLPVLRPGHGIVSVSPGPGAAPGGHAR